MYTDEKSVENKEFKAGLMHLIPVDIYTK
jgi:hypothetical protein